MKFKTDLYAYMEVSSGRPLSATGNLSQAVSPQSGAVVCPASLMRLLRPRSRTVSADRIQNAYPGSKPCGCNPFFRARLSDYCPAISFRALRANGQQRPTYCRHSVAGIAQRLLPSVDGLGRRPVREIAVLDGDLRRRLAASDPNRWPPSGWSGVTGSNSETPRGTSSRTRHLFV